MVNENRLIDANALMEQFDDSFKGFVMKRIVEMQPTVDAVSRGVYDQVRWERDIAIGQLESYGISLGEKADVAKVRHGRWIEKKLDNFRKWELRCSQCDWVGISNYDAYDEPFDFNYCPNCGAKMDGDGNA